LDGIGPRSLLEKYVLGEARRHGPHRRRTSRRGRLARHETDVVSQDRDHRAGQQRGNLNADPNPIDRRDWRHPFGHRPDGTAPSPTPCRQTEARLRKLRHPVVNSLLGFSDGPMYSLLYECKLGPVTYFLVNGLPTTLDADCRCLVMAPRP